MYSVKCYTAILSHVTSLSSEKFRQKFQESENNFSPLFLRQLTKKNFFEKRQSINNSQEGRRAETSPLNATGATRSQDQPKPAIKTTTQHRRLQSAQRPFWKQWQIMGNNGTIDSHCRHYPLPLSEKYIVKQVMYKIIRLFSRHIKGVSYDNCSPNIYFYGT